MATIKKACKGTIYPKSSSVSSRLGSTKQAKKGIKVKKAQDGLMSNYKEKSKVTTKDPSGNYKFKIKQETGDGKIETTGKVRRTLKGFFSGAPRPDASKKNFSSTTTYKKGGVVKKSMKKGGKMTKKCAYGCK